MNTSISDVIMIQCRMHLLDGSLLYEALKITKFSVVFFEQPLAFLQNGRLLQLRADKFYISLGNAVQIPKLAHINGETVFAPLA